MPAQKKSRSTPKYKQHDNVRKALQKIGVEENMRTATMLFDWAVSQEIDNLSGAIAKAYKATTKTQTFTKLRDLLKEHGYIDFAEPKDKSENAYVKYAIGSRFRSYVNKELAVRDVVATRTDVERVARQNEENFKGLSDRVDKLESLVKLIIAKTNPPVTEEKIDLAISNPETYIETFIGTWN